ncbi:hypothetical protein [Nocardia sp. NPDC024068]|uniref:hypothetical protein n=1 Tax=Nocardia sp. NPDC024068 TaxID=3157197 RepID=UPI0033EB70B1
MSSLPRSPLARLCLPILAAGLLATGCAAADEKSAERPASAETSQTMESLRIEVRLAGGTVTPVGERLEARVGQPIEVLVDSDTADELHVHAHPDHTFAVSPGDDQRFRFTVDIPGRVDIELHHAERTVATVLVRE